MHVYEQQVIELIDRAENRSFRDLVESHERPVYVLAHRLTGNHHDAEDLSQEVFIQIYRSYGQFRGEADVHTWLYRITVNLYLNRRRKKAQWILQLRDSFTGGRAEPRDTRSPERGVEADRVRRHVERALRRLSPQERAAFVLRYYNDLTNNEVARAMEVSEGTVKSLLFRAMQKLRKALAFYRPDLGLE